MTGISVLAAAILAALPYLASGLGGFINQDERNLTVIKSPLDNSITLSYKEPKNACKTALDSRRQITGWVTIPGDFPTNLFFWFVEAREKTDLLSVWLAGGPGSSSMAGFFTGAGPCEVIEDGRTLTTQPREWGWDRDSNMLFIDQPNQVGFSYNEPVDATFDVLDGLYYQSPPVPLEDFRANSNWTVFNGTLASFKSARTANTTTTAARAVYQLMQTFLAAFPEYKPPPDGQLLGVNLFAESYGGIYAPVFATVWQAVNEERKTLPDADRAKTVEIDLWPVGIINGCSDDIHQAASLAEFMRNNFYGLDIIDQTTFKILNASIYGPGGCIESITACWEASNSRDPDENGDVDEVNTICREASRTCFDKFVAEYRKLKAMRSVFDIAFEEPSPFPRTLYMEHVQSGDFVKDIGASTNFTQTSNADFHAFYLTGDGQFVETVPKFASLLDKGIRVSFLYGDRDFRCSWLGGEKMAIAVAEAASSPVPVTQTSRPTEATSAAQSGSSGTFPSPASTRRATACPRTSPRRPSSSSRVSFAASPSTSATRST